MCSQHGLEARPAFLCSLPCRSCACVRCVQVLPALKEHHAEFLLKELYKRWGNHKIMVRWLSRFFNYLDRRAPLP